MIYDLDFSDELIIHLVKDNYDMDVKKVYKIDRGSADIYLLYDNHDNKYIFKAFQSKYTKEDIDKEIDIIRVLKDKNIEVPHYIKLINNDYSFIYNDHVIIMQDYVEGNNLELNTGSVDMLIDQAKLLASIVNALEGYNVDSFDLAKDFFDRDMCYDKIDSFNKMIDKLSNDMGNSKFKIGDIIRNIIIDDLKDKIKLIKEVLDNTDISDIDKMTHKVSHGDFNVLQLLYSEDNKIKCVLDFASAKRLPVAWEIIRSFTYLDKECVLDRHSILLNKYLIDYKPEKKNGYIDKYNLRRYIEEYNSISKLNEYDIKYMLDLYLIQLLTSSYGYKQYVYNDDDSLLSFALFRTNLARYIYENKEEIQEELNKIKL